MELTLGYKERMTCKLKGNIFVKIVGYIVLFLIFYSLNCVKLPLLNNVSFTYCLLFALLFCKYNMYIISPIFLISALLWSISPSSIIISLNVCFVCILIYFFYSKFKNKNINKYLIYLYALLSQIAYVVLNIGDIKATLLVVVSLLISLGFLYCCISFCQSTLVRGFNFRLNLDEKICGSVILIILSAGISNIYLGQIEAIKIFAVLSILLFSYLFNSNATLLIGTLMGVGYSISVGNPIYISVFTAYSLISLAFKSNLKFLSCIGILGVEILLNLYFDNFLVFNVYGALSVVIGSIIFLILPLKILKVLSDMLGGFDNKVGIRNVVNRSKEKIVRRMMEISEVFSEMDRVFKNSIKGNLSLSEAKQMVANECANKVCRECSEKNKCLRLDGKFTTEVFDDLIAIGFEKGKVGLLDVPQYLIGKCGRVNYLINNINQLLASYKNYVSLINNMDASKVLIGEQLGGVSGLIKQLAKEINLNISFDIATENRIVEELSYKNIICLEAIVYEISAYKKCVTLIIKNDTINEKQLEKIVSKTVATKMQVTSIDDANISGASVVTMNNRVLYDVVFGSATISKNGVLKNGDSHSLIKIDDSKYMLALCDGMGSGDKAHAISETTITLIENFYKAGFDNEIILSSVNKLLCINNEEDFSSVDMCVLNLNEKTADFIKLGSPSSFLKRKNEVIEISSSGLPIGVLEEMRPHITKTMINDFDIIILMSDGIYDLFDKQSIIPYLNNIDSINPQLICNEIMENAKKLCDNNFKDDMTVIALRVYPVE